MSENNSEKLLARLMLIVLALPILFLWALLWFAFPDDIDLRPGRVFTRMMQVWTDGQWTLR